MPNNRIVVESNCPLVLDVLRKIAEKYTPNGMRGVMGKIGQDLAKSTQQRFDASISPEGFPWKPLAEGTVLARLQKITKTYYARNKQNIKRDIAGKLNAKGSQSVMSMKQLVETRGLSRSIVFQITNGGAGVEVGTNRFAEEWEGGAAVHQFGTNRAGKNHNITIPARPFLGLSKGDKTMVLDILNHFIEEAAKTRRG